MRTSDEWISVKDKLPEDDKSRSMYDDSSISFTSVLACGYIDERSEDLSVAEINRLFIKKTGIPSLDKHYTGKWEWSTRFYKVTHWQPLPEPPKERKS